MESTNPIKALESSPPSSTPRRLANAGNQCSTNEAEAANG
jgi:hypothetical protein